MLMIPVQFFTSLPLQVMAAAVSDSPAPVSAVVVQPPPEAFTTSSNAPALAKALVPVLTQPSRSLAFSTSPSDSEIIAARLFEEPLAPLRGDQVADENTELAKALVAFSQATEKLSLLTSYIEAHPDSRWKPALLVNLGLLYRSHGYWSKALAAWETAWPLLKTETTPSLKNIGDRALGELAQLHSRLGHFDRLESLFKDIEDRDVQGSGTERIAGARSGLWLMKNQPGEAFRCGPLAVARLFQIVYPREMVPELIHQTTSTQEGTCLGDLAVLAAKAGLDYQMAFREPGAPVLFPSVIHWKVGHFAALTKPMQIGYLTQDLTFGIDTLIGLDALDSEASGYFLVPAGKLPTGWRSVSSAEAKTIFGKGNAGPTGPPPPPNDAPQAKPKGPCEHMAGYNMELAGVSLMLTDTPVGYSPPVGPAIQFTANYNHRESAALTAISNLGSKWSFGWLNYIMAPTDADTRGFGPGGGQLTYTGFSSPTASQSGSFGENFRHQLHQLSF